MYIIVELLEWVLQIKEWTEHTVNIVWLDVNTNALCCQLHFFYQFINKLTWLCLSLCTYIDHLNKLHGISYHFCMQLRFLRCAISCTTTSTIVVSFIAHTHTPYLLLHELLAYWTVHALVVRLIRQVNIR